MEDIIKIRDALRDAANILDEFIDLNVRADNGEEITNECASVLGRFMLKMLELQALQEVIG